MLHMIQKIIMHAYTIILSDLIHNLLVPIVGVGYPAETWSGLSL